MIVLFLPEVVTQFLRLAEILYDGGYLGFKDAAIAYFERAETASGKDVHLIFWAGRIVFNPKMTIFMQINREIKK